jgi:transketolase
MLAAQPQSYRDAVLPPGVRARVSVEAAAAFGWERFVGPEGAILGLDRFGASASREEVMRRLGFTVDRVLETARTVLAR